MNLVFEANTVYTIAAILIAAALLHACFQLSVSVMTLLSGHALGAKRSHARLMRLTGSYVLGNIVTLILVIFAATYLVSAFFVSMKSIWAFAAYAGIVTGVIVMLMYYRDKGTRLWIPQSAAEYLHDRAVRTKNAAESFGLGMVTAISELPFLLAPLIFVGMILRGNPDMSRVSVALLYSLIATLPLLVLFVMIGSGKNIGKLQKWREHNRRFLQFSSGLGLIALSLFVLVTYYFDATSGVSVW